MSERNSSEAMLSVDEAAATLGYSTSGLRKLIARRELRYFQARPHAPIKFRREWLNEFIEAHSAEPGPELVAAVERKKKAPRINGGAREFSDALLAL